MMKPPSSNRPVAFSLLELLVSLVVIAILVMLLLPAVGRARSASDTALCIRHLKTLGAATMAYAADHDGYLPPSVTNNGVRNTDTLEEILEPYVGPWVDRQRLIANDAFYCPANERIGVPPKEGFQIGADGRRHYKGWSGYMMGYTINAMVHPMITYLQPDLPRVRLSQVRLPSKVFSLADINPRGASGIPAKAFNGSAYFIPGIGLELWFGGVHNGWCHLLFLDGHVGRYKLPQRLPVASMPEQERPWFP